MLQRRLGRHSAGASRSDRHDDDGNARARRDADSRGHGACSPAAIASSEAAEVIRMQQDGYSKP